MAASPSAAARDVLYGTLSAVFLGDAAAELERRERLVADAASEADRAVLGASAAMAAIIACRFERAASHAERAVAAAADADAETRRVCAAVLLMCDAMAGTDHATGYGIALPTARSGLDADAADARLTRYLLAEAALSSGAAEEFEALMGEVSIVPELLAEDEVDGAAVALLLVQVRALAFRGRGAEAGAIRQALAGGGIPGRALTVLTAIQAYAAAQSGDRALFLALADEVLARTRRDAHYLSVGSGIYIAWGMRASGQLQRASALLTAVGGTHLERCKIWDRALGFELLVEAALDRRDLARASEVLADAEKLARYTVAASPVARTLGALAGAAGRVEEAYALALAAVQIDESAGATAEAQRGRLMQAAALAASDPRAAAELLHEVAEQADARGNEAIRSTAAQRWHELAATIPGLTGGLAVMTPRQREVVSLLAEGHSNPGIAQVLFLSPRTVQSHVAEILRISGARSRSHAVSILVAPVSAPIDLSPRQREVAVLVAEGLRNTEIAARLGLSEKTVEHHVGAVLRKFGVLSRSAVAALVVRG